MKKLQTPGPWIWASRPAKPNELVVFRRKLTLEALPAKALAYLAAETRYYLSVNGREAVFEGGLLRESIPGGGWADAVDLAPFLRTGENTLEILVHYWGNGGRNNTRLPVAGLMFACPDLGLFSDEQFLCQYHPGFYTPGEPKPSYLYGGDNLGLDLRKPLTDEGFAPAVITDPAPFGELLLRPIPQTRIGPEMPLTEIVREEGTLRARLPFAMAAVPVLQVRARGGEIIRICTDRRLVHGGPGDDMHVYSGHRLEFICKPGENRLETILPLYGEELEIVLPDGVELLRLGCRCTGYDCDFTGSFHCSNDLLNALVQKAARTLYVCMRDNFMDCPDRERGQWIGDVSVQIPQVAFLLDEKAMLLVKKAIHDFVCLRRGDVLVGNVPGEHAGELPAQSLAAISQWGLAAQYWKYSGDKETLALLFRPAVAYLRLWQLSKEGLVLPRQGGWQWYDHLYNCDGPVMENAWYLSALKFMRTCADILDDHTEDAFLEHRIRQISAGFEACFWKKDHYGSGDMLVDDRANALAVLSGACPRERYPAIRNVLVSVFNSTVYMENFVLTALCEMGCFSDARNRMLSRYYNLAVNENSTLWEDFFRLGTRNHAWSGAPAVIAFRYFLGVDRDASTGKLEIHPRCDLFPEMSGTFRMDGKQITVSVDGKNKTYTTEIH